MPMFLLPFLYCQIALASFESMFPAPIASDGGRRV